jgi:5-methylcytosine-specific restriction endonuclease McrA
MEEERICRICKQSKPMSEYYKGKCYIYTDGYDKYCKICARAKKVENEHNPKGTIHSKRLITDSKFWCPKCKQYKNKEEFYTENFKRSPSGHSSYCIECDRLRHLTDKHRSRSKSYYYSVILSNPLKIKSERKRKLDVWRRFKNTPKWRVNKSKVEHLRRQRVKNSKITLTEKEIDLLLKFQKNSCACCKRKFSDSLKYEIDHIIPVSKGGDLILENVQLLCKSCNCSKGDKVINYLKFIDHMSIKEAIYG